jgi:hypothetical protein
MGTNTYKHPAPARHHPCHSITHQDRHRELHRPITPPISQLPPRRKDCRRCGGASALLYRRGDVLLCQVEGQTIEQSAAEWDVL